MDTALPGPVIREQIIDGEHKRITCRLPGVPVRADGSHEVSLVVPRGLAAPVVGTTF
jgi:hypothetical protein